MNRLRIWGLLTALLAPCAFAQGWAESYDAALAAAKNGNWVEARKNFQAASALRAEDVSGPTTLPGSVTDPKRWRNGSPYSPNFGAAYSALKAANGSADPDEKANLLKQAAQEFWVLLDKGQISKETTYFLAITLAQQRDVEAQRKLDSRLPELTKKMSWRVDTEFVAPEEVAAAQQMFAAQPTGSAPPTTSGPVAPASGGNLPLAATTRGLVAPVPTKYALVIGQSECQIPGLAMPVATSNAMLVREGLVMYAGYSEANVDVVMNATAQQIMNSAKALVDRMPDDGTLLIYFCGAGVNLDGKDYFAGIDTKSATDTSTMVAKMDIYQMFIRKGTRIFAFFEAHRPIERGRYFGMEVPMYGAISQMQSTIPGERATTFMTGGKEVGAFAEAFAGVLMEFRSNRVPVTEFAWSVFNRMRRGDLGTEGGGIRQTPTLPVLSNMPNSASF